MDTYEIWVDLAPGVDDLEFVEAVRSYLAELPVEGYRIRRRKFGFGPEGLGEFVISVEVENLAQLDAAFQLAAERSEPLETLHRAVFTRVVNFRSALYRDFPDPVRGGIL